MKTWRFVSFQDTLRKNSVGKKNQINASEIKESGLYPVIDQGQSFIAGYSDEHSKVVKEGFPLIIFGDHTRCFKYVDFYFILGADGTKVLSPNPDLFDPKFYYFALLNLNIPNRGYNRHFKFLKECLLPLPPFGEQKKISFILSIIQHAIEQQEHLISLTTELKKASLQKLFTEGTRREPQRMTEIGMVPLSWKVVKFETVTELIQYGTSVKCDYKTIGKPVLRIPNVVDGKIDLADVKYGMPKPNEVDKLRIDYGDLLFVRTNGVKENSGRCSIFRDELSDCYYASYLIRAKVDKNVVDPEFINDYTSTQAGKSFLSGQSVRTADGKFNINSGTIKRMLIPIPDMQEQSEITSCLQLIDKKMDLHNRKKANLEDLFRTLLHKLMTAQIRVNDLELDELNFEDGNA